MTKARDLANASTALSAVSATELGYVDGVTSAIQTQLDAKAASSTAVTLTGTQTLTNKTLTSPALTTPTISTATTNGDILYGTGSGALTRLGIGSSAQVLTVASGVPSWATPAGGGGMTLLSTTSLNGASGVSLSGTLTSYKNLQIVVRNPTVAAGGMYVGFRMNSDTGANYVIGTGTYASTSSDIFDAAATSIVPQGNSIIGNATGLVFVFDVYDIQGNAYTAVRYNSYEIGYGSGTARIQNGGGVWKNTAAVTAIAVQNIAGTNFTAGDVLLYGVS